MSEVIRMYGTGGPSVLVSEQERLGAPEPGQVKIRHGAIGINFIDSMYRNGTFSAPLPFVTGVAGAGEIIERGPDVEDFSIGERVAYFFAPGAYAQERLIHVASLVKLPTDVPFDLAAGLLTKGATAWLAVRKLRPLGSRDTALVQGVTGGVGSLVTLWAKKLGATVIAVGSGKKLQRLRGIADHVVPSESAALTEEIRKAAPQGVDVVYDLIGRATFAASLAAVREGGDIFTIGAASGAPVLDPQHLADRRINVSHASAAAVISGNVLQTAAAEIFEQWREGTFGTIKLDRYPLTSAARAHQAIIDRTIGPVPVLIPLNSSHAFLCTRAWLPLSAACAASLLSEFMRTNMTNITITRQDTETKARYGAVVPGVAGEGELTLSKASERLVIADHTNGS